MVIRTDLHFLSCFAALREIFSLILKVVCHEDLVLHTFRHFSQVTIMADLLSTEIILAVTKKLIQQLNLEVFETTAQFLTRTSFGNQILDRG